MGSDIQTPQFGGGHKNTSSLRSCLAVASTPQVVGLLQPSKEGTLGREGSSSVTELCAQSTCSLPLPQLPLQSRFPSVSLPSCHPPAMLTGPVIPPPSLSFQGLRVCLSAWLMAE